MAKFNKHTGLVAPLAKNGVDTDAIIPKQFLQKVTRSGFGQHLFHDWRYLDDQGLKPNPEFVLNQPVYQNASILLTQENFGCGSSREHAPWALSDYGFKAIIGQSFADIFYNNSFNNGLLLINLPSDDIAELFKLVEENSGITFSIDLEQETLSAGGKVYSFKIDGFKRHCLLNGLDSIGLTLEHEAQIKAFEDNIPAWKA